MKKKKNNAKVLVNILSVLFILFVLLELQIMFNYPDQFVWFVGIGALILVDVYFLVSVAVNQKNAAQADKEEQFKNITMSEKASYLLLKKSFQDLDERMSRLEEQIEPIGAAMAENEIKVQRGLNQSITDNKKVAKILIGKTKENTDALMNSNVELRRLLQGFEQKLSDMEDRMGKIHASSEEGGMSMDQYQKLLASIQSLEKSFQRQVDQMDEQEAQSSFIEEELEFVPDFTMELEAGSVEDTGLSMEPDMEEEVMEDTDLLPEADMEEEPEVMLDTDLMPEPEPIFEPEPEPEPILEPEPIFEPEPEPESKPMSALQTLQKMKQESKAAKKEAPPAPDVADPNKVMSPEEIAALIANM